MYINKKFILHILKFERINEYFRRVSLFFSVFTRIKITDILEHDSHCVFYYCHMKFYWLIQIEFIIKIN